jgi:hypothetical protein
VTGYGETIEAAKMDLESAIADVLDFCKKEGKSPDPALNGGNLEFSFKYDIERGLHELGRELLSVRL